MEAANERDASVIQSLKSKSWLWRVLGGAGGGALIGGPALVVPVAGWVAFVVLAISGAIGGALGADRFSSAAHLRQGSYHRIAWLHATGGAYDRLIDDIQTVVQARVNAIARTQNELAPLGLVNQNLVAEKDALRNVWHSFTPGNLPPARQINGL